MKPGTGVAMTIDEIWIIARVAVDTKFRSGTRSRRSAIGNRAIHDTSSGDRIEGISAFTGSAVVRSGTGGGRGTVGHITIHHAKIKGI